MKWKSTKPKTSSLKRIIKLTDLYQDDKKKVKITNLSNKRDTTRDPKDTNTTNNSACNWMK